MLAAYPDRWSFSRKVSYSCNTLLKERVERGGSSSLWIVVRKKLHRRTFGVCLIARPYALPQIPPIAIPASVRCHRA